MPKSSDQLPPILVVSPKEITFYVDNKETHTRTVKILNGKLEPIRFEISGTGNKKYKCAYGSSVVGPHQAKEITFSHTDAVAANIGKDRFRIEFFEMDTKEFIEMVYVQARLDLCDPKLKTERELRQRKFSETEPPREISYQPFNQREAYRDYSTALRRKRSDTAWDTTFRTTMRVIAFVVFLVMYFFPVEGYANNTIFPDAFTVSRTTHDIFVACAGFFLCWLMNGR